MSLRSTNPSQVAAKERQAQVLTLLDRDPARVWSAAEIALELWRFGRRKLMEAAVDALRKQGRIELVRQTKGGNQNTGCNQYRAKSREAIAS